MALCENIEFISFQIQTAGTKNDFERSGLSKKTIDVFGRIAEPSAAGQSKDSEGGSSSERGPQGNYC